MSVVIIEFYDSGVRISNGETILATSSSCALIESDRSIIVGSQAEQQAHLRPRECSTLFWSKLSNNSDTKHVISNAEIALHHLEYVCNLANYSALDTILITPVTFDKRDLGLLLGICKKLSIKVVGVICNAALAIQHPAKDSKAVYFDLLQQQLAVTEIVQNDKGISIKQPCHILNYGLHNFMQLCANTIAKKFIAETRFDPLHTAKDEQRFIEILPTWLRMLAESHSIECKLNAGEKYYVITINNADIKLASRKLLDEIAAHLNVLFHNHGCLAIFCSSSCKKVFGLQEFLSGLPGCAILQLDESSMAKHALRCHDEIINGEQIHYVNALSWHEGISNEPLRFNSGQLSNLSSIPTHILIKGHAYSLRQDIFIASSDLGTEPRILREKSTDALCKFSTNSMSVDVHVFADQSVNINNKKIEAMSPLKIGDVLSIDNYQTDYVFIKVAQDEA